MILSQNQSQRHHCSGRIRPCTSSSKDFGRVPPTLPLAPKHLTGATLQRRHRAAVRHGQPRRRMRERRAQERRLMPSEQAKTLQSECDYFTKLCTFSGLINFKWSCNRRDGTTNSSANNNLSQLLCGRYERSRS